MKHRNLVLSTLVLAVLATSGCGYNTLQSKQQNVKAKWANIEVNLQRRADLVPNLFEAAKAAAVQEQEVFNNIAAARSKLLNTISANGQGEGGDKTPEQKQAVMDANNSFGGTLGRLLSLTENYPNLRSSEAFMKVQDELAGTENRIAVSRQDYNAAVQDYNTARGNFPMVIAAKMYGFKEEPLFKADDNARQAPQLNADSLRQNKTTASPAAK
jgi:LemA protein